jgi:monoamine oxidase
MGHVVRLTLRFDHPFWMDPGIAERLQCPRLDQVSFIHARRRRPFPVWWTTYPVRSPLLVAWVGGPGALAMSRLSPRELEAEGVAALARLLSTTPRSIRAMLVESFHHDWVNDPFARGVYSYSRVGGHAAPHDLAKPVRGTIWFAGEATVSQEDIGTVHGALASGQRAAQQILRQHGAAADRS